MGNGVGLGFDGINDMATTPPIATTWITREA
jgi:hypothetical protein